MNVMGRSKNLRVFAVSSGGGHWVQLLRLKPAFKDHRVMFASVHQSYATDVEGYPFQPIRDATRWDKWSLILMTVQILWILMKFRPHLVISTGAAPGYVALRFGKLLGARTIWLDSMANVEELSLSGQKVEPYADLWLTQWPHLATNDGPKYSGSIL